MPFARPLSALLPLLAVACVVGPEDTSLLSPPENVGKADVSPGVQRHGALPFGGSVLGTFEDDFEFHAYTLIAAAGSEILLEVTRTGSSPTLATGLFLYGPRVQGGGYGDMIARDYDSGYGKLSRLRVTLEEFGSYLVVVGTADGMGRGQYRLGLSCDNAACDHVDDSVWASCDEGIAEGIRTCIGEAASELDPGDDIDYPWMIEACTDPDNATEMFGWSCGPDVQPAPFCPAGGRAFAERMLPVCREALGDEYEIRSPVTLQSTALPDSVATMVEGSGEQCGEACWAYADAWVYDWTAPTPPTLREVTEAVRLLQREPDPAEWSNDGPTSAAVVQGALESYGMSGYVEAAEVFAGAQVDGIGHLSTSYYAAPGAEAWVSVYVLHFPSVRMVQAVLVGAGET